MWVYSREDLDARLRLPAVEGLLLDYWLMLHADDTHPIVSVRPFGIQFLAKATARAVGRTHKSLRRALGEELESLRKLGSLLPFGCPSDTAVDPGNGQVSHAWLLWLERALEPAFREELLSRIQRSLVEAVASRNLAYVTFLLRRSAAEIADEEVSLPSAFNRGKSAFLRSPAEMTLEDRVAVLLTPSDSKEYRVTFGVAPVGIPAKIAQVAKRNVHTKFVFSGDAGATKQLVGIQVLSSAEDVQQAVARSIPVAREVLQRLRLGHFVATHLHGPVRVAASGDAEASETVALPTPFWRKSGMSRQVPRVPMAFRYVRARLDAADVERWDAAVWHLAASLKIWSEDRHAAASSVWQGLEGFAGDKQHVLARLVPDYLKALPETLLTTTARDVGQQRRVLLRSIPGCDWVYWDANRYSVGEWARWVLSRGARGYWRTWSNPVAPLLLGDPTCGLLPQWCSTTPVLPRWARQRLVNDLHLLSGLRNAAVHAGVRVGNGRVAAYLARVGLEMLFEAMNGLVDSVRGEEEPDPANGLDERPDPV